MSNLQGRRLIIGGHDIAEPQRYPYYVAIDKNNGVIVSGALIAPDIVLSAGHVALDAMENITIKVGPFAVHESESFAETIPLKSYLLYKNWTLLAPGIFAEDYMIFQLAAKSTHKPVRLNRDVSVPPPGQFVTMMGLGWTDEHFESPASRLQEVELVVISNEECEASNDPSRPDTTYKGMILESMICTKSPPNTTRDGW
jgi:Trypsin